MSCRRQNFGNVYHGMALAISAVFGVSASSLYAFDFLPNIETLIWSDLGLGIVTLVFLFIDADLASLNPESTLFKCLRCNINFALAGDVGTIFSALTFLSISPEIGTVPLALLVGVNTFFFSCMAAEWASLLNCILLRRNL